MKPAERIFAAIDTLDVVRAMELARGLAAHYGRGRSGRRGAADRRRDRG